MRRGQVSLISRPMPWVWLRIFPPHISCLRLPFAIVVQLRWDGLSVIETSRRARAPSNQFSPGPVTSSSPSSWIFRIARRTTGQSLEPDALADCAWRPSCSETWSTMGGFLDTSLSRGHGVSRCATPNAQVLQDNTRRLFAGRSQGVREAVSVTDCGPTKRCTRCYQVKGWSYAPRFGFALLMWRANLRCVK
ncbi:hypothetical protein LIA77_07185 [Sarocladium implicatum]|nr:hypothetical protein LIA77_07185 [Sarocladium implicatum]